MTKITALDLMPIYRSAIGVDRLFDRIMTQMDSSATDVKYPPYDIVKTGENTYEVRLAAAGFRQGEIDVQVHENTLRIQGNKDTQERTGVEYLHHGISNRSFLRTFPMGDYMEVREAVMQDGILTVKVERVLPESAKPKTVAITYVV